MNNFYLTRPATSLRHRFLPWDKDNAFSAIDSPIDAWLDENVLVRRALTFADLRERFDTVLVQCAALSATDDWLAREVDRIWALVAEAAHTDTKKQFSNAELDEHITFLKAFGRLRPVFVLQSLGVRAAPTP
jgi:hypothetical protein